MKTPAMRAAIRGFTLIELLIVLVIIVAISGAAMPVFLSNSQSVKLKASARRLADLMRFCHGTAVFECATMRVNFSLEEARWQVTFEKDPIEAPGVFEPYMASSFSSYKLQDGILIRDLLIQDVSLADPEEDEEKTYQDQVDPLAATQNEELYIEFRPDGTTDDAIIVLENAREEYYSIAVTAYTATVRVYEGNLAGDNELDESEEEYSENGETYEEQLTGLGSAYE